MSETAPEQRTNSRPRHHLFISVGIWFATLCWGSAYVAARFLLHPDRAGFVALSPLVLAASRFGIASLFLVFPLGRAILRRELTGRQLLLLVLLGQLTFSLYYLLQYIGIELTNASISSILGVGLIPLFTALLAHVFGVERMRLSAWAILLLGFFGVALIVFQQPLSASLQSGFLFGALCLIGNTFSFAVYSSLSKRWMQHISPVVMTAGTMISGTLGLVLFSFLDPVNNQWSTVTQLHVTQWGALLFLAIGCSVLAYFAYNFALSKRDASRVTVYFYAEPVVAIVLGMTLLGEHLTWQMIIGGIVITVSVIFMNVMQKENEHSHSSLNRSSQ